MKRLIILVLVLLLLSSVGVLAWTAAGLPPVRMLWQYGLSYHPEPTGEDETYAGIEFVSIGPGCFRMGSNQGAKGGDTPGRWCARFGLPWGDQPKPSREMPVHWVEFQRGFWIAKHEVTNAQYEAFAPKHERSKFSPGDRDPVVHVTWEEAKKYCAWLSQQSGRAIRLPSESEWECACRAGSVSDFCFGDEETLLGEYAWYEANSDGKAHPTGHRRANAWGIHDLHGNVSEWCQDRYHASYMGAPADGTAWSVGGESITVWREAGEEWEAAVPARVVRGGHWVERAGKCRSAVRSPGPADCPAPFLGFRLALSQPGP